MSWYQNTYFLSVLERDRFTDWSYGMPVVDGGSALQHHGSSFQAERSGPYLERCSWPPQKGKRGAVKHKITLKSFCMRRRSYSRFPFVNHKPHFKGAGKYNLSQWRKAGAGNWSCNLSEPSKQSMLINLSNLSNEETVKCFHISFIQQIFIRFFKY